MLIEPKDVADWCADLQDYNKHRKERGYDNPKIEMITQRKVKEKEKLFDPLLQIFNDPIRDKEDLSKTQSKLDIAKAHKTKRLEKYQKDFNIVNLEKLQNQNEEKVYSKSVLKPIVREFNIITNTALEKFMYENVKVLKQERVVEKKVDLSKIRDFNIISNMYQKNHESKIQTEQEKVKNMLQMKYDKTHQYNFVNGQCFDPSAEKLYQENYKEQQLAHGKDANSKLPPSLRFRETIIFDRTKPIPEDLKLIDEQKRNAKKRYQLRYAVENEYHERNIEEQERNRQRLTNGLCDQKYLDEHKKGFDLITLEKRDIADFEKLISKKPNLTSWEKVQLTKKEDEIQTNNSDIHPDHFQENNNYETNQMKMKQNSRGSEQASRGSGQNESSQDQLQNEFSRNGILSSKNQFSNEASRGNLPVINSGGEGKFSKTESGLGAFERAPRQRRNQNSQKKFDENQNLEKQNLGSIISTESNQNKFRIKTGGFNN